MTVSTEIELRPVPGPRGLPLLGNLPAFGKDPLSFFSSLRDEYGDAVTWSLGSRPALFVAHPAHIAELMAEVEHTFEPGDVGWTFAKVCGESILRSRGAQWRRKRAMVQPTVRPKQVRGYATTMVECAQQRGNGWREGGRIDVGREMERITQRIVSRTLFGNDLGARADVLGESLSAIEWEMGAEVRSLRLFLPPWVPSAARRRLLAELAVVDEEVGRLVRTRRQAMDRGEEREREDLLSRLLAARDGQGQRLSSKEVRDEAVTLWIAGNGTSTTALTWTWYLLARNPGARTKLTAELQRVLGDRSPSFEDYESLTYTRQVIKESLRLYPPAWVIPLRAKAGARLGGHAIRAGDAVWCSQWVTHRDPRWFTDPLAFRPERWDGESTANTSWQTWFPFGTGPRTCVGARFAQVETALVLATLARRWHLEVDPGEVVPQAVQLLQPSTPVRATVRAAAPPST
ncbi:cytochrome P450 [Streptomyces tsukubensis]|nr:cytochrome P450 [Streptomyces tsukubensis]